MSKSWKILNPKQEGRHIRGRAGWYPYYAGFSQQFASALIGSCQLKADAHIIDPWNGGGTTTSVSSMLGYSVRGFDLNPTMVIAAKARMLSSREGPSLIPLVEDIIDKSKRYAFREPEDGLCIWFDEPTGATVRGIEASIQHLLVSHGNYSSVLDNTDCISDLAAFFYVALFRLVKKLIHEFSTSNPTWIKQPKYDRQRLTFSREDIWYQYRLEIDSMKIGLEEEPFNETGNGRNFSLSVSSSDSLPIEADSVDLILTSPPYCTRIDYAVATKPELAILGYKPNSTFDELRRRLIGTATVPKNVPDPAPGWGDYCIRFLQELKHHVSKASGTYYYKNHVQYFDAIYRSLAEISRISRLSGYCFIVIQDSYYKDLHNDLPKIFTEMAHSHGLELTRREDFEQPTTMAGINRSVRAYRKEFKAVESVLCFQR